MNYLNFNDEELTPELKELSLLEVRNVCLGCYNCDLSKTRTNVVFSDGNAYAPVMLIGEAPGADEDASGVPFVGRAGKLLNQLMEESGMIRIYMFVILLSVVLLKIEILNRKKNLLVKSIWRLK